MTCRHALLLLEDFVDEELSPAEADEVSRHFRECRACRLEYEAAKRLKGLLSNLPSADPGSEYWEETMRLIMARTTGAVSSPEEKSDTIDIGYTRRRAFVRSLVSAAASLIILISALALGSSYEEQTALSAGSVGSATVYAQNPCVDDATSGVTCEEQARRATGMLLIGPPGVLGRIAALTDFSADTE